MDTHFVYLVWYTDHHFNEQLVGIFSTDVLAFLWVSQQNPDIQVNTQIRREELDKGNLQFYA
jgi:hypothetical protein